MKIVCISDVHEQWHALEIPECDVLISAGDYSYLGKPTVVAEFHKWLARQKARHIISVQGNHEKWVEAHFAEAQKMVADIDPKIHFWGDEGAVLIEGVKFYGSAFTPWFNDWAYQVRRGEAARTCWARIPDDVDVLITHGPAYGILDQMVPGKPPDPKSLLESPHSHIGCEELRKRIDQLESLELHVFGHIHGSSGVVACSRLFLQDGIFGMQPYDDRGNDGLLFVNAAICNDKYKPVNPVRVVEI